jgi:hypothetical protein
VPVGLSPAFDLGSLLQYPHGLVTALYIYGPLSQRAHLAKKPLRLVDVPLRLLSQLVVRHVLQELVGRPIHIPIYLKYIAPGDSFSVIPDT